jgi:hypothetical protein
VLPDVQLIIVTDNINNAPNNHIKCFFIIFGLIQQFIVVRTYT